MIATILIGLLAGWLAGMLMRGSGYGIIADIVLGLVGAVVGRAIFMAFGVMPQGALGLLTMATVGALVLVGIAHALKRGA